ncbi:MAG: peptidyl-prolyl cis-trans isomerase [Rhodospirillaceae bacterium]|nr:peptidyl-prolyl cis-trans isomerase [Rhodospirillaceae bacterium]
MIEYFRGLIKDSIILKIFLGLLTLSFGIWGVGDFIGAGGLDPSIALKIGKTEIRTDEFQRRYTSELERFKQSMGATATTEESFRRAIVQALIQDLTRTATIDAAGRAMDVVIPRDTLFELIRDEKAFADPTSGQFSQMQFAQVLAQSNLTERGFVDMFEQDLRSQRMIRPIAANAGAPKSLVDAIFAYRNETRVADTLLVTAATLPLAKTPTDDDIKKVYDANISTFTAPEYRKVSAVVLTAKGMVKPEDITEADLKAYYDQNNARYKTPAKRHVVQVAFDSEEKAAAAKAEAKPGESLAALAARLKADVVDMGDLGQDSPLAKTIAVVFVLPANEISPPVQTDLGWHLFEVTSLTPEVVKSFDEVKDQVRTAVAADKGTTAMYDASVQLEDQVAAGASMEEAAKLTNGAFYNFEMDRDGNTPFGASIANIPDRQAFIRTAFSLQAGADSGLKETAGRDGYYVLKVDGITPPKPKPLADVKAQATVMWEKEERTRMAKEIADKAAASISPSTAFSALEAADKRLSYSQLGPVTRFGESPAQGAPVDPRRVSPELLEPLFKAKVGDVVTAPVVDGFVIARVKEIRPAQPNVAESGYSQLAESIKAAIGNDLMEEMSKAFGKRYPLEINNTMIDDLVSRQR